jgi:hypothetical protein
MIQNFLNSCGADSVNVLQNGWIIDDKGTGEFKFDAGVIGTAYVDAGGLLLGSNYDSIIFDIADYFVNVMWRFGRFVFITELYSQENLVSE